MNFKAWLVLLCILFLPIYGSANFLTDTNSERRIKKTLPGIWYGEATQVYPIGPVLIQGTTEYFSNNSFNFNGLYTLSKLEEGNTIQIIYFSIITGEWSVKDDFLLEKIVDVKINPVILQKGAQKIDLQKLPYSEKQAVIKVIPDFQNMIPKGLTTKSQISNLTDNRIVELCDDGIGGKIEIAIKRVEKPFNYESNILPPKKNVGIKIWTEPVTGMEFIWVEGGCYQMGDTFGDADEKSDNIVYSLEKPIHRVCVDGFWLGKTEVTQGQWHKIMGSNPSKFKKFFKSSDNYPVESVSWNDSQEFIKKLNQLSGKIFRLPYEAEWEYAARSGGKNEKYAGGSNVDEVAWYESNSEKHTHPVGSKHPNGLGLYDMSGNVWEWCQDVHDRDYYRNSPQDNPHGPDVREETVLDDGERLGITMIKRGGAWNRPPWASRASNRDKTWSSQRFASHGFRLALPSGQ